MMSEGTADQSAISHREWPARQVGTTLYVWGYQPPQSVLLRERGKPTEAARRFAAEQGWDRTRAGAWAMEITLPMARSLAWGALEPLVSGDSAVAGWSGQRVETA
jgi:hypothetical protein